MYHFTDDCLIGIPELDKEHEKLFQLINEAQTLLADSSNAPVLIKNILNNLFDYADTHFAHEEAYMEKINDPELSRQKKEHAAFRIKLHSIEPDSITSDTASDTLKELLAYLIRWLYRHILSSDIMIGKLPAANSTTKTLSTDPFAFTDEYLTGIALVDEEHHHLFDIIRDINDLVHEELLHDKFDEIMRILDELKNYTEFHFHDEETYMQKINYPGLEAQKMAHAAFVEKLVNLDLSDLDEIDENQQTYLSDLINFLLGWLSNHILKMDKEIGIYERSHN